ncbi:tetratricopeptide repeat protein 19 homolog, mitochondrial isoform X1 [Bactrocera neohumeralis]|uniref:tetratricopeptide repeat protein 19 homolog, mitochondrial isoform X1 n=1 Tax=Bactrocera neohumeralis TaxID=98809 RepID=UPI002166B28F|nr:tetratricopeptide repeat protein 19 homolog, mitochondrial isoform X1 [Bactrocera neohumeralis]
MNSVIVFSISQYLARNLKVLNLRQVLKLKTINGIEIDNNTNINNQNQKKWKNETQHLLNAAEQSEENRKQHKWSGYMVPPKMGIVASGAFSFGLFGKTKDEETPEDKLITTIKRSVLCIQRQEFDKAEQMLHLALRMAQDLQSKEGVTYIYDVMANLAMEREQFKKAEKLFAEVMKRLFSEGYGENSSQVMHISAKLAHMAQLQGELDKAMQGFTWTLKRIEDHIKQTPNDKDVQELLGLTKNWLIRFGQLQMKLGKYADAKKSFQEAYDSLVEVYGRINEESITILNNLSVACVNLEEYELAKKYLMDALELVKELKDTAQEGVLQANLGLIYLREGLIAKAKEACSLAWRIGKNSKNLDAVEQAEYCLNEIKSFAQ